MSRENISQFLITLLSIISITKALPSQQLSFYSELNFEGTRTTIDNNAYNIRQEIRDSKSLCVDQGLWKANISSTSSFIIIHLGGSVGSGFCENRQDNPLPFASLEYIGEKDLATSSITLFQKANYQGGFYFLDGTTPQDSYDSPQTINSYYITGTYNWAAFNGTEYSGVPTCLRSVTSADGTYGARASPYLTSPLQIGSLRRGCEGDEITTTRRTGGDGSGVGRLVDASFYIIFTFVFAFFL